MFRSTVTDTAPPTPDVMEPLEPLVPLSVLQLDLDTPPEGWSNFLAARSVEVTLDDIGRMAVARAGLRRFSGVRPPETLATG